MHVYLRAYRCVCICAYATFFVHVRALPRRSLVPRPSYTAADGLHHRYVYIANAYHAGDESSPDAYCKYHRASLAATHGAGLPVSAPLPPAVQWGRPEDIHMKIKRYKVSGCVTRTCTGRGGSMRSFSLNYQADN